MSFRTLTALIFLMYAVRSGSSNLSHKRTTKGELTTFEEHPYIVYSTINGYLNCGGSLITPTCVLSAAHCYYNYDVNFYEIEIHGGKTALSEYGQIRKVQKIFAEHFNHDTADMDLAILKLNSSLEGENISTITLELEENVNENDIVTVPGWGSIELGSLSENLLDVDLFVVDQQDCSTHFNPPLTENMFCLGDDARDTCKGNSGGPAIYKETGRQVGIVSFGADYKCGAMPGVYVRLASKAVSSYIRKIVDEYC